MRILHVTPFFFSDKSVIGGGERYVSNVCKAVATVCPNSGFRSDILSLHAKASVVSIGQITDLHLIPFSRGDMMSCAGEALDNFIETYDVIHVHQCLLPWGIFIAARARVAGKIVLGSDHGGGECGFLEQYPMLGRMFDCFHAQSQFATTSFMQMNTPIRVIYGPVDETLLPFGECKRDQAHFVMLGRVLPHKGYEHAINALPKGARLSIIGRRQDKGYFTYLKNYAKGKAVYFESDLDDLGVGRLLSSAGLYLHTGTHFGYRGQYFAKPELLGIAPLEAMCTGTPAIVSQAGALPELAKTVGCKTYASETALREMLHTHMVGNLFQATPNEIRADAIKHYGLQQFGKAYLELIAEIAAKEKSSAHSLGLELIPA